MLFSPVQVELLNAPSPTEFTAALDTVLDQNIVLCQIRCLREGDAGDLGGDVRHRSEHNLLARIGEGVVEFVFYHRAGPQPVGVSQVGVQGSRISLNASSNDNVAFDGRQPTSQLPLSRILWKSFHNLGCGNGRIFHLLVGHQVPDYFLWQQRLGLRAPAFEGEESEPADEKGDCEDVQPAECSLQGKFSLLHLSFCHG